uniref:Actin-binding lim zn-finger protein limatin involved in axon guidance n=1 Tax=Thelazia callipaeda TaxID=103827 RepID=A0A0N5CWT8_THECL
IVSSLSLFSGLQWLSLFSGKKCCVCKKKCVGEILKAEGEKYIHISCFKCAKCSRSLKEIGYYTGPEGQFLCAEDFRALTVPLQVKAKQQPLKHADETSVAAVTPPTPSSPPPLSPAGCASCGQPLQTGQVLLALEEQWHVWCFKCSECSAVLQGEYMTHDGKPFCIRDYNLKYGVRCYECDKYIAGKVLQAGGYKFHPTCARCSRCGEHFGDGQEMYMQGDEIWHPGCEHKRVTENILPAFHSDRAHDEPKYHSHFGQHLTYMYLLPEAEQTYLKQPIPPHPPQPAQFHTPQGAEDLERNAPRPRSPHMDNEEPIEMAHYPAGHAPEPGIVPPIEREDFPAPPYPYAVEELKRRLSSSSVENDDDEIDYDESDRMDEEKLRRAVEQLDIYDKDSSIAYVIKQNLEESHKKQRLPLHWDPRNASRTPSAKKMPHLRFRYDTPVNASPSRHINRPKPWVYWQGHTDKAATTSIPFFHIPKSRMTGRAATLPDGYHYGQNVSIDGLDRTINSHFSDQLLQDRSGTLPDEYRGNGTINAASDNRGTLRSSLPDMSKPAKIYPLSVLHTSNKKLPDDVDRAHLERHLNREQFEETFSMSPIEFYKLPEWKRINLKRKAKLF